jgi:hypothetical protein
LSHSDASIGEQRVSNLVGDRLCITCGYNLIGQPVLREPHYQMLIVRCPECATVASLQEYPLLGRWANRWAVALASLWLLTLIVLWIGSGAAIFGIGVGAAEVASEKYREYLSDEFQQWVLSRQQQTTTQPTPGRVSWNVNDYETWIRQQDMPALFQKAGGWRGAIEWRVLWVWLALIAAAATLGCIWSVALLGRKKRGLLLWGGAIMIVAVGFSMIAFADWYLQDRFWYWRTAEREICPSMMVISLALGAVALIAGLMCGRSLTRGLIRALLPPRLRWSLAQLWIADGLELPRSR